jgi:hypothetical protein
MNEYQRNQNEENQLGKEFGARFDDGKLRYDLLPPKALEAIVEVYTYGANKYDANNWWKGMKWSKVIAPLKRHIEKWLKGEENDEESQCHHLAHAIWNLIALYEYERNKIGIDDRMPYNLELMSKEEREERIKIWRQLVNENNLESYNGNNIN